MQTFISMFREPYCVDGNIIVVSQPLSTSVHHRIHTVLRGKHSDGVRFAGGHKEEKKTGKKSDDRRAATWAWRSSCTLVRSSMVCPALDCSCKTRQDTAAGQLSECVEEGSRQGNEMRGVTGKTRESLTGLSRGWRSGMRRWEEAESRHQDGREGNGRSGERADPGPGWSEGVRDDAKADRGGSESGPTRTKSRGWEGQKEKLQDTAAQHEATRCEN